MRPFDESIASEAGPNVRTGDLEAAARIVAVADVIRQSRRTRTRAIEQTCDALRPLFARRVQPARAALAVAVANAKRLGLPPSFVRVSGLGNREKPYNRLLGWWLSDSDHGAGFAFARALAVRVGLSALAEDLDAGERPTVRVEKSLAEDGRKEPDAVVLTSRSALLIENKVDAPESGDQYAPYLRAFRVEAAERATVAILLARESRATPPGWSRTMTHQEIADLLVQTAGCEGLPFWSRVCAQLSSSAFADETPSHELLHEADALLARAERGAVSATDIARMQSITRGLSANIGAQ